MTKIYLLRHGKVDGPAALYGHTNVGVSPAVNNEIISNFHKFKLKVAKIYSSPLKRCYELSTLLSNHYNCALEQFSEFKEMNFGDHDGVAFDDLYQSKDIWQQLESFWRNPVQHPLPNAELLVGFSYRVKAGWHKIIRDLEATDNHQDVLIVCHGGVIRMLLSLLLNIDYRNPQWYTKLKIANASLTSIEFSGGQCSVQSIAKPLDDIENETDTSDFCRQSFQAQCQQQVLHGS